MAINTLVKFSLGVQVIAEGENPNNFSLLVRIRNGFFSLGEVIENLISQKILNELQVVDIDSRVFRKFSVKIPFEEQITLSIKSFKGAENLLKIIVLSSSNESKQMALPQITCIQEVSSPQGQNQLELQDNFLPQKRKRNSHKDDKDTAIESKGKSKNQKQDKKEIKKGQRIKISQILELLFEFFQSKKKSNDGKSFSRTQFCQEKNIKSPTLYHYEKQLLKKGVSWHFDLEMHKNSNVGILINYNASIQKTIEQQFKNKQSFSEKQDCLKEVIDAIKGSLNSHHKQCCLNHPNVQDFSFVEIIRNFRNLKVKGLPIELNFKYEENPQFSEQIKLKNLQLQQQTGDIFILIQEYNNNKKSRKTKKRKISTPSQLSQEKKAIENQQICGVSEEAQNFEIEIKQASQSQDLMSNDIDQNESQSYMDLLEFINNFIESFINESRQKIIAELNSGKSVLSIIYEELINKGCNENWINDLQQYEQLSSSNFSQEDQNNLKYLLSQNEQEIDKYISMDLIEYVIQCFKSTTHQEPSNLIESDQLQQGSSQQRFKLVQCQKFLQFSFSSYEDSFSLSTEEQEDSDCVSEMLDFQK